MSRSSTTGSTPAKVASASFIGTSIEFYDFFIFGTAAALVFPTLFFPGESPLIGALLSFATFGVGFFARPVGGIVFGHFGDRVGRKKMLVTSLVGMGAATFLMGLLPTYATIGIAAPICLALLRLVQGFCVGGEWGGATLMAVEHAPPHRRGFYGAFAQMGSPAGVAIATLAFLLVAQLSDEAFLSWGWRLPFMFSAVLVILGLAIRLRLAESPAFTRVRQQQAQVALPAKTAVRNWWRQILLVAGIFVSQGIFAYICMSYLVSYGTSQHGLERTSVLLSVFAAAVVATGLYAVFGAVSDRIGRRTTYTVGAVAMAVAVIPTLALIETGSPVAFAAAMMLMFGFAMAPAGGATGSLFAMMFGPEVRYTGVSLGYTLAQLSGAAFAPLIATALFAATSSTVGLALYLLGVSGISILSLLLVGGPWGRSEAARQRTEADAQLPDTPGDASAPFASPGSQPNAANLAPVTAKE
ncbi:MFS transporter [Nocardia carnea]|uniref:MFS transporter n=1 Tax=Nocardia carnea TaxID=37328 RepID=UPI0024575D77|nr:MFS transporter [Nocardia carnea]